MGEIVDIEEEAAKYKDEWVLFEVIEVDDNDIPVKGRLLFHGSRDEMNREDMKVRGKETYGFFTGEPVPPNVIVVL